MAAVLSQVLNMSIAGGGTILVVLVLRRILRRAPKIFSYILWAGVLFRLLCPAAMSEIAPVPVRPERIEAETAAVPPVDNTGLPEPAGWDLPTLPEQNRMMQGQTSSKLRFSPTIFFAVWAAGTAGMLLYGVVSCLRFRVYLTGAVHLRRNVYQVDHIDSAFAVGLIYPKIYIPSNLPPEQQRFVLAHERHHLRRFDHIIKHLAYLALCVHWFNPLVWLAFVCAEEDMEMSCDEAVLGKLGEGIRADYVTALINMAARHPILTGSPLPFGEGNTKRRVRNLSVWKKPWKWTNSVAAVLCAALFTACAAIPTQALVVLPEAVSGQIVNRTDSFRSTDGTVIFRFDLHDTVLSQEVPILRAAPHMLTGADVKRITEVLFGEDTYYEPDFVDAPTLSKAEIRERLTRWGRYSDSSALNALYGSYPYDKNIINIIQEYLAKYGEALAAAPETVPLRPTQWQFQKENRWSAGIEEDTQRDMLVLNIPQNGVSYRLCAITCDWETRKQNTISVYPITNDSPGDLDWHIYEAQLCRTQKPTQTQVVQARQQAQSMLEKMQLGEWVVEDCVIGKGLFLHEQEYSIDVTFAPANHGIPTERTDVSVAYGMDTPEANYAFHYYQTSCRFMFSADGKLVCFVLDAPIEMEAVETPQKLWTTTALLNRAEELLKIQSSDSFFAVPGNENQDCRVTIEKLQYNLLRIKDPDSYDCFTLVPGLILSGSVEYFDNETGEYVNYYDEDSGILLSLNALDGSVIQTAGWLFSRFRLTAEREYNP